MLEAVCLWLVLFVLCSRLPIGFVCRLYNTLEWGPSPNEEDTGPDGVDATLVRQLQAAVVVFVTDVMHRAIVWKETQMRLNRRSSEQVYWASIVHDS